MSELDGTNVLVTGATRGIGAAIADALAAAGARLVLAGRESERLAERAAELGARTITADLADPGAAEEIADRAADLGVDALVNNAGISGNGPSDRIPAATVDEVLAVDLRTPLLLAARLAGHLAERGGGSIVTVSSALAGRGATGTSIYAAAKGGMEAATRALAAEWGPAGVRVNAVRPAITRSDMTSAELPAEAAEAYVRTVPLRRIGEPADVAALVRFLVSPAGAYVTGQVVAVDGGWTTTSTPLFG